MHRRATARGRWLASGALVVTACAPQQSTLHPAGVEAAEVARLFWIMAVGGAVIWAAVLGITLYAVLGRRRPTSARFADSFVFWGGVVFPTVTLAALLVVGLSLLPNWRGDKPPDLRVHVSAEQFWWRITYETPDGSLIESANEVHLPARSVVEFVITSPDVIHSFWIPALGGKMDAIPGRTNLLRLTPTDPGTYRGVCAEYCGLSHALMAFVVQVHPKADFGAWLAAEAQPATVDAAPFRRAGCAACHSIRGVMERGRAGPDLTHLARRQTIGAATLPLTAATLRHWLRATGAVKPDVHMPAYAMLPEAEIDALVTALMELR
jgi:cytochrome c oxidase subunit 2